MCPIYAVRASRQYVLETSVYPRETEILKGLRRAIDDRSESYMSTNPDSGQFIEMVLKLLNAKKTIEVGVFTGYSVLLTAMTLQEDGKVIAIDINRKHYDEVELQFVTKANVEHKIDFIESPALPVLDDLLANSDNEGTFGFAYVAADRGNAINYHKRLVKLVRVGGVIIHDNTLWGGTVTLNEPSLVHKTRLFAWEDTLHLNKALAADSRVEISQVTLGDGMTICRRVRQIAPRTEFRRLAVGFVDLGMS